jgi:hypothetical protein
MMERQGVLVQFIRVVVAATVSLYRRDTNEKRRTEREENMLSSNKGQGQNSQCKC